MQVDFTPTEVSVLSGVLMAQYHPVLLMLRDRDTNEILASIMGKLELALMAEAN